MITVMNDPLSGAQLTAAPNSALAGYLSVLKQLCAAVRIDIATIAWADAVRIIMFIFPATMPLPPGKDSRPTRRPPVRISPFKAELCGDTDHAGFIPSHCPDYRRFGRHRRNVCRSLRPSRA
jgi:hypothetical protein